MNPLPAGGIVLGLDCVRCRARVALAPTPRCRSCGGELRPAFDLEAAARSFRREGREESRGLARFRELLAFAPLPEIGGIGATPLVDAPRLSRDLGLRRVVLKNEGLSHPTCSFKDRAVAAALAAAKAFGFRTVCAPSTGNLANSTAALARMAGIEARVFVPEDLEEGKIAASASFGPGVVRVRGSYDDARALARALAEREGWAVVNDTLRPFYGEGSKTISLEVAEELGRVPEQVVVPMGSGLLLDRIARGFEEARALGLAEGDAPRLLGVQAAGCAPIVEAFRSGSAVRPVRPATLARSIAVGDPASAESALAAIRSSVGEAIAVSDEEIVDGIGLLARTEGIFGETACGAAVAALKRLAGEGTLDRDATTLVVLTGNGWKTVDALRGRLSTPVVPPDPDEAARVLGLSR